MANLYQTGEVQIKKILVRLTWIFGFVVIGCGAFWLIAPAVMFFAIIFCPSIVDQENPAYVAEADIDGYTFEVTLIRNHPLLAEYLHFPRKPELPSLLPHGKPHLNECDAPKFRRDRFGLGITDGSGAQAQVRENPDRKLFGTHGLALSWFGQAMWIEPSLEKHGFSRLRATAIAPKFRR